jgi:hypothetical protein
LLLSLVVLVSAGACTSYKRITVEEVPNQEKIRVTTADGKQTTMHDPRVEAGGIEGRVNRGVENADWNVQAIPSDQIVELEAVSANTLGTIAIAVGALGALWLVLFATSDPAPGST